MLIMEFTKWERNEHILQHMTNPIEYPITSRLQIQLGLLHLKMIQVNNSLMDLT